MTANQALQLTVIRLRQWSFPQKKFPDDLGDGLELSLRQCVVGSCELVHSCKMATRIESLIEQYSADN